MKKLFLTVLIAISPMTFAKDFNPNLLVGKWQCEEYFDYPIVNLKGKETSIISYNKDGTYHSQNILDEVDDGQKNVITLEAEGRWRVKGNILSVNTENLISYQATNPNIEGNQFFEEGLRNDKSFLDMQIINLTENKLVLNLPKNLQDDYEVKKYSNICRSIK